MTSELWRRILDLPAIVQGAFGSAVFWLVLQLVKLLGNLLSYLLGQTSKSWAFTRRLQEYIYRRYTESSGYLPALRGQTFALNKAFKGLLAGLIYCSIALAIGGLSPIVWGICFIAAIVYFGIAWSWLSPSASWSEDDRNKHWTRVADLEKSFFGKVDKETQEILDKLPPS